MNLQPLFETQAILDKHILDKHNLYDEALLDKKILALQVELGELANEWRGFKFWSENQEPRTINCPNCNGKGIISLSEGIRGVKKCAYCRGTGNRDRNPLLEEYVDGLHFILGIGNDFGFNFSFVRVIHSENIISAFSDLFEIIPNVKSAIKYRLLTKNGTRIAKVNYQTLLNKYFGLGEQLGFTWEQIEQAYFAKNKINHERQEQGY